MRAFLLCIAACIALASCSPSEKELKKAGLAGDLSFVVSAAPSVAYKAAAKNPETPLFVALKILSSSQRSNEANEAAALLLTAAAGLTRDSSRDLTVDAKLQRKIPFLHRATALFRLCTLARQSAAAYSATYAGGPLSAELEELRGDILFLERVINGKTRDFLLPALDDGGEFALSSLSGFAAAKRALSEALVLTEPVSEERSLAENEAAVLRRLVLQRHYNAAATLFFRSAARLGYEGKGFSLPESEGILPVPQAAGEGQAAASEKDNNLLLNRDFLSAAGRALLYSDAEPDESVAALEHLLALPALSGEGQTPAARAQAKEARYTLKFYIARLLAKTAGRSSGALAMMESSLGDAPTDEDRDISLWYMLDIARARGNDELINLIEARLAEWRDPEVFADILTKLVSELAAAHSLEALLRLEAALPADAPARIRERVAFTAALLSPAGSGEEKERLSLLAESANTLYYKIRSAELLGNEPWNLQKKKGAPRAAAAASAAKETAFPRSFAGQALSLIKASIAWNLPRQAASFAESFPFARFADVQAEAQKLMKPGHYSDAMRLLSFAFSEVAPEAVRIEGAARETLEMLYPQLWRAEVAQAAAATHGEGEAALGALPESLIFGVIRQESFFDPSAVSHAGAKGLMQLMDLTAGEVAGKLKVSEYDLFDAETSIRFGSFYLSEMKRRLYGESLQAVCAYNAGIGRVRGWLRDYPPALAGKSAAAKECIFVESVPFNETREYAKRVFTSAAIYSALYY